MLTLYDYWRSSAAFRVRIGLRLKGVDADQIPVNIRPGVNEQMGAGYLALNPQGRVPALQTGEGLLAQSLAILEWLEEVHPEPPLLPGDAWTRAKIRAFALTLATDVHPLNNVAPLSYLREHLSATDPQVNAWIAHWMRRGLAALEAEQMQRPETAFTFGDQPTLADVCLAPQMYSARRFGVDLSEYPRLSAIDERAGDHPAFAAATPENQKDASPS